MTAKNN